jgi:FixJ family two-component response regulator
MQIHDTSAERAPIHFIEADTQVRAELAKAGREIGHYSELYTDLAEMAAHPAKAGLIIARDQPENGGIAYILDRLLALGIWLPVVAMDFHPTPSRVVEAIKAGALDYLDLPLKTDRLHACISKIQTEAAQSTIKRQRAVHARNRLSMLSPRENEVLEALSTGGTNKEIARQLDISPRTVEIHRANMMSKLGARHAAEAIRLSLDAEFGRTSSEGMPWLVVS